MKEETIRSYYPLAFGIAIAMHIMLFLLFFIQFESTDRVASQMQAQSSPNMMQAVTVDQNQVNAMMDKIQQERQQKAQMELEQKNQLQKQLAEVERQRQAEQAKIAQLNETLKQQQAQQKLVEKQQAQKLAQLKQEALTEEKKLNEIKQARLKEQAKPVKEQDTKSVSPSEKKPTAKPEEKKIEQKKSTKNTAKENMPSTKNVIKEDLAKEIAKENEQTKAASADVKKKPSENEKLKQQAALDEKFNELAKAGSNNKNDQIDMQAFASEIDEYKAKLLQSISRQWLIPENVDRNRFCKLFIKLGKDGAVLDVQIIQSSGDPLLDRSAVLAVRKASPLPLPDNPLLAAKFHEINLTVRPESILSAG